MVTGGVQAGLNQVSAKGPVTITGEEGQISINGHQETVNAGGDLSNTSRGNRSAQNGTS